MPTGINSTTGISGLTLGGGFGWITRKFGLTIDNLVSADVVTADGKLLRASQTENPDLFWALRGGGGNFGIVTAFEFQLHQMGPQVLSGLVVHPFADAEKVLEEYRKALETAPDELTCWVVMRQAPPLPFLPAEWHGKDVLVLAMCYCGDLQAGEKATKKLRAIGSPIADVVGPNPFTGWQQAFDPLLTPAPATTGRAMTSPSFPTGQLRSSPKRYVSFLARNVRYSSAMSAVRRAVWRRTQRRFRNAARTSS